MTWRKFTPEQMKRVKSRIAEMETDYEPWRQFHRDLADYILPARASWLHDAVTVSSPALHQRKAKNTRNTKILDATGTRRARDLAAGMLNGVTSPARPWFRLRVSGFPDEELVPLNLQAWLDEVVRRTLLILAESNFYNAMAVLLLELVVFGTAGMLAYEDFDDVVRFYNLPIGNFRIATSSRRIVDMMSRSEVYTVRNLVNEFGEENCTRFVRDKFASGLNNLNFGILVHHLIEPNRDDQFHIPGGFSHREFYWEANNNPEYFILRTSGYNESPGTFPRWETIGTEAYGVSPGMEALPDIMQLQQETLRKAQIIDKYADPPTVFDASMRRKPTSTLPGGRNFAPSSSSVGAKALYDMRAPLGEITMDISDVRMRIGETFFNDLFRMISSLDTVRSATEIDARREEKLIMMGAVLERLENEALDPIINRVFGIMRRKGLLPELPPEAADFEIEVQYVSVLSDAQRAVGTASIERFGAYVGELGAIAPEVLEVPNWSELVRDYAERLNVPAAGVNSRQAVEQALAKKREMAEAQQAAMVGKELTGAAKNLADSEVGGGSNALQELLG